MSIEVIRTVAGSLHAATLALDHGPANVLDLDHCREITRLLGELRREDRVRLVVFRGKGRFFSAGVDIKQHTPEKMPELLPAFHSIFRELLALKAVTIAAVHGLCLGGAAELALACDRVVAARDARFAFPEMKVGCYPPVAIALLPGRVGAGHATEMILGGGEITATALASWGGVDRLAPDASTLDASLAEEIALYQDKSPAVLGMAALLLHDRAARTWGAEIDSLEKEYLARLLPHPDASEGIAAFGARRQPRWQDTAA